MSTPLIFAIKNITDENVLLTVVETLLNFGADPNIGDVKGRTSLFAAVGSENTETIEISFQGQTPFVDYVCRQNDRRDVCEKLLKFGADVNLPDAKGRSPLMILCKKAGSCDLLDVLLEHGADINARDNNGRTSLIHAAANLELEIIDRLLAAGANVNATADDGMTPLIHAVDSYDSDPEVVERLLEAGANPNACNDLGKTSLAYATENGRDNITRILLQAGAK